MMRKTKIVCTIGPACEDEQTLIDMVKAGMNVARLNFSHGRHEEHQEKIDLIKAVRSKLGVPLAIMLDTKGPEYRIGTFKDKKVILRQGDRFVFTPDDIEGDETRVSVSYKNLADELGAGDQVLVNNGLLIFTVTAIEGRDVVCRVDEGGEISNRKSMSFPGKVLHQIYLSEHDKEDLLFGIKNDVDYIACSFVSCKQDVLDVVNFLRENGADKMGIIAKIENRSGIDNIEDICSVCDGIMIGRGDMGVEIPFEELTEGTYHKVPPARQARYHRDRDARVDDKQSPPDESGDIRRCKCGIRRYECYHALRRNCDRQAPRADRCNYVENSRGDRGEHKLPRALSQCDISYSQRDRCYLALGLRHGDGYQR